MKSLKDRLEKIESLLKTAGILNESNFVDEPSDDEDGFPYNEWEIAHRRAESFAHSSDGSCPSQSSPGCEAALFPGGGDLEATSLFRQHERDDSRYFGVLSFDVYSERVQRLTKDRPLVFIINTLTRRDRVDQKQDRRRQLFEYHISRLHSRQSMESMATGCLS